MVSLSYLLINAFFTEFILNSKNETTEHIIWLPSLHVIRIRASKGRDVPGQSGTGRPVVPLSGNKNISLSHRPSVPGQGQEQKSRDKLLCTGTSRDKITFPKKTKKQEKDVLKKEKDVLKQERMF
jgi:hypothetical protein